MRYSHLLIIFFIIMGSLTLTTFFYTNVANKAASNNNIYSDYLTSATESGVHAAFKNRSTNYLFDTNKSRQAAIDAFYKTLVTCFNYDNTTSEELVKYYVPCVFLIDNNGFYIEYTETYVGTEGYECYKDVITPINKWGKLYSEGSSGKYYVEYHLDDTVTVVKYANDRTSKQYSGKYSDVYKKLKHPSSLSIFSSEESFEKEKNECIILEITDQLTYFINTHDEFFNQKNDAQYHFTLPMVKDEDWARLIDQPTIFAFMQGIQVQYNDSYINIYAMTSSEVTEALSYYLVKDPETGVTYYHEKDCPHVTDSNEKTYSMEEAAKKGAYPCQECIR